MPFTNCIAPTFLDSEVACWKPLYTDEQRRGTCWRCYASGARRFALLMALGQRLW